MYFRPKTEQIFQTHSEIRAAFPETSFPALLTDEIIQDFKAKVIELLPDNPVRIGTFTA